MFSDNFDNRDALLLMIHQRPSQSSFELKKMADSYDASAVQENLQRLIRIVLVQSNAICLRIVPSFYVRSASLFNYV